MIRTEMIKMIVQSQGLLPVFAVIAAAVILVAIGVILIKKSPDPLDFTASRKGRTGALLGIAGCALLVIFWFLFVHAVPLGSVGIDESGRWYEPGWHIVLPGNQRIIDIPLFGTVPISLDSKLEYRLTKEEVFFLDKGKDFPDYLKEKVSVRYDGRSLSLISVPQGIDPSHLTMVIRVNPVFI